MQQHATPARLAEDLPVLLSTSLVINLNVWFTRRRALWAQWQTKAASPASSVGRAFLTTRCLLGRPRLKRLALEQLRHLAEKTGGLTDEDLLERRHAINQPEADVAREA